MATASRPHRPQSRSQRLAPGARGSTGYAFTLLRVVFTLAPIAFGLDKFANLLTEWPAYLAPWIDEVLPGTAQQAMYAVGVVEIAAGIVVAWRPRLGGLLVALWLGGVILNLLSMPGYYDVALRDFGLLVAALALSTLASREPARDLLATTAGASNSAAGAEGSDG